MNTNESQTQSTMDPAEQPSSGRDAIVQEFLSWDRQMSKAFKGIKSSPVRRKELMRSRLGRGG